MLALSLCKLWIGVSSICVWARSPPPIAIPVTHGGTFHGGFANVVLFGAVGDGQTDSTEAFNKAIASLAVSEGGVLVVPKESCGRESVFVTRPLLLNVSNVTLRVMKGATVRALCDISTWPVGDPWASFQAEGRQYLPFLHVANVTDFATEGGGTIDGNGSCFWDASAEKKLKFERPRNFVIEGATRVSISGLTVANSPFWNLVIQDSEDVHIQGVTILNPSGGSGPCPQADGAACYGPNADGIDLVSVRRALVEDCEITAGDDCVCIKSGLNGPGRMLGKKAAQILVRNITIHSGSCPHVFHGMGDGCGGFKVGTEMSGGVEDVIFEDSFIGYAGIALKLSAPIPRGGSIKNITFRNISIAKTGLVIALENGNTGTPSSPEEIPKVWNITFADISVANVSCHPGCVGFNCNKNVGWLLSGAQAPLHGLKMTNVVAISGTGKPLTWECSNTYGSALNITPALTCLKPYQHDMQYV